MFAIRAVSYTVKRTCAFFICDVVLGSASYVQNKEVLQVRLSFYRNGSCEAATCTVIYLSNLHLFIEAHLDYVHHLSIDVCSSGFLGT